MVATYQPDVMMQHSGGTAEHWTVSVDGRQFSRRFSNREEAQEFIELFTPDGKYLLGQQQHRG